MTIAEAREKCKAAAAAVPRDALVVAVLLLTASASFGLGLLAGRDAAGQGSGQAFAAALAAPQTASSSCQVFASKNGARYYFPWCSGADRISAANRVTFASPEAATAAGYTLAAHCGVP
jgi:hypothetical protein